MAVRLFAGDLRTGQIKVRNIPSKSGSATATVGAAGTISCTVKLPLRDPITGVEIPFADLIIPGKSFLGFDDGGKIINAGPIWNDVYDFDTGKLTLTAAGIKSYWDFRYVMSILNDALSTDVPAGHNATFGPTSLRTIAKRVVANAQTMTNGSVPLVMEADFTGTNTRVIKGEEMRTVGQILSDLSGVQSGPDIAFPARYKTDPNFIEWVMLTGNPELVRSATDHRWDLSSPTPTVKGAQLTRDATGLVTDAFQMGSTPSGATVPVMAKKVDTTLPTAGYLRFEDVVNRSTNGDVALLQQYANEAALVGRAQVETYTFKSLKSAAPTIQSFNEGDYGVLVAKGNPRVPDGGTRVRILSYTSSIEDQFATISCAPERIRS